MQKEIIQHLHVTSGVCRLNFPCTPKPKPMHPTAKEDSNPCSFKLHFWAVWFPSIGWLEELKLPPGKLVSVFSSLNICQTLEFFFEIQTKDKCIKKKNKYSDKIYDTLGREKDKMELSP